MTKGQRVVTSSHFVASETVQEPGQILIGVTSPGGIGDALQQSRKDGALAEYVLLPAETITPIKVLDGYSLPQLTAITRCIVPFGGLVRGRLRAGETVIVNGASGAYGSAAVLVALGRIICIILWIRLFLYRQSYSLGLHLRMIQSILYRCYALSAGT